MTMYYYYGGPHKTPWMKDVPSNCFWRELKMRGDKRKKRALYLRNQGLTYSKIGDDLGISLERARQLVMRAKRDLAG